MRIIRIGRLAVIMEYSWHPKGKTITYKRRIPEDVRNHYPDTQKFVTRATGTHDERKALPLLHKINIEYEAHWDRLRSGLTDKALLNQALDVLDRFGLAPQLANRSRINDDQRQGIEFFYDHLDSYTNDELYEAKFNNNQELVSGILEKIIPAEELLAAKLLNGNVEMDASMFKDEYYKLLDVDRKQRNAIDSAFNNLIGCLGDRPPDLYTRKEVRVLIASYLSGEATGKPLKTKTIHRRLTTLSKVFRVVAREYELRDFYHPFTNLKELIPDFGEDAESKPDFSPSELKILRDNLAGEDDDLSRLIMLLIDTGMRVNEACGLRWEDITTNDSVSFLRLHKNCFRRLKTKNSQRFVPLVGPVVQMVSKDTGSEWVFPRYVDIEKETTKNDTASASANKRIRAILGGTSATCHSFRHTMQTRLRNVDCPSDVREECLGWVSSVSATYGNPTDIRKKMDYYHRAYELEDWYQID